MPDRSTLPEISRYAHLRLGDGATRIVGFVEGSRGCKHLCRHCPVVPVYKGKFRVVPMDVVMGDIRQQVAVGAEHVSFGDPDFLNGPTHALRLAHALHSEFPALTYDATIKVEHIIKLQRVLPVLKGTGCLFVISAVEAVDDVVLGHLDKNHTNADFDRAVALLRDVGISFAPTFVAFTPWTTLRGYIELLERLVSLRLVESVPPIQLAIRLLIPLGSYLLHIPGFVEMIETYDEQLLGYPWKHEDPAVDELQCRIQGLVESAEQLALDRKAVFAEIWFLAHKASGEPVPALPADLGDPIPHMSEPWYCCAEPTTQQLQQFCLRNGRSGLRRTSSSSGATSRRTGLGSLTLLPDPGPGGKLNADLEGRDDKADAPGRFAPELSRMRSVARLSHAGLLRDLQITA